MEDLLADFIAETRDMLAASGSELVAWEADPSDRARIDTIFRFVHTVKGNCGFFNFPELERLSHAAEDALAECRAGRRDPDRALVDAVLAVIDRIGEMTDAIERGDPIDGDRPSDLRLIAALEPDAEPFEPAAGIDAGGAGQQADGVDAEPSGTRPAPAVQRSIRLPVDLLDEVMKGVSDMVLARNDLARRLRDAGTQPTIDGPFERLSAILADVRASITRMRMQRLEHLFATLPRMVRDLSAELGKQVMVDCEGGEVELDREMIEMVRDPLTHLIRNAIDHGIETPQDRLARGKREIGLLRFSARQSGNQIHLVISDDGRGIDTARLGAKAVAAGLCTPAELAAMDDEALHQLIFEPGLSTAEAISAISGRGVGMDVVRANIEKVGGGLCVSSRPGEGTVISLRLPLTLSIMATLTVRAGAQTYAIPQSYVEEIVFGNASNVAFAKAGSRTLVTFRGRRVPCLALSEILGIARHDDVDWQTRTLAMLRLANNDLFALAVDRVLDHEEVVVKPIAPAIMATRLYAGTTLLDDGRPMMLLDIPSIASRADLMGEMRSAAIAEPPARTTEVSGVPLMLATALDGRTLAFRLDLVRRIETVSRSAIVVDGDHAQAVIDGHIFPLEGHRGGTLPEGRCRLLHLSDGAIDLVHAIREVRDTAVMIGPLVPVPDEPLIEGRTLIGDEIVSLVDGHALFARHAASRPAAAPLTCRLPADSEWAATILRPLLELAGYTPLDDDGADADLAIIMPGNVAGPQSPGARHTLCLSDDPRHAVGGVIYRYDRDGLLNALEQLRHGVAA